jgi:hypothetical protein
MIEAKILAPNPKFSILTRNKGSPINKLQKMAVTIGSGELI